ncbi:unnamed protein product, partial [Soboliphyme baturini]|uniref:HotDog ACOT-type domain-containing protein n=1 Tax=Soboliphyme baturini TaxID=241478 RepID=A0A183IQD9_9BILA
NFFKIRNSAILKDGSFRKVSDSRDSFVLPFKDDLVLRRRYVNIRGNVRFGKILENMDTFAVWLAYRHCQKGENMGKTPCHPPMIIVTACVDRIALHSHAIMLNRDVLVEGRVTWVGRSSMEVIMDLLQKDDNGEPALTMRAKFVMVARHPTENRSVDINPLKPQTDEEISLYKEAEKKNENRRLLHSRSLLKVPPNEFECGILHDLSGGAFEHRVLPKGFTWMEDHKLKNTIVCFSQERNLYGKIFGGFLMRSSYELAWTCASLLCGEKLNTLALDSFMFRKAVEIGSFLFLESQVCYTNGNHVHVRVLAEVLDIRKRTKETTNTFHFFFGTDGEPVKQLMPRTYAGKDFTYP